MGVMCKEWKDPVGVARNAVRRRAALSRAQWELLRGPGFKFLEVLYPEKSGKLLTFWEGMVKKRSCRMTGLEWWAKWTGSCLLGALSCNCHPCLETSCQAGLAHRAGCPEGRGITLVMQAAGWQAEECCLLRGHGCGGKGDLFSIVQLSRAGLKATEPGHQA